MKKTLLGLSLDELKNLAKELGFPAFVGGQIADWIYKKRAEDFEQMTNLSKAARAKLSENFVVGRLAPIHEVVSNDGTKKYLFSTASGSVETVYIPDNDRVTVCISSQVGCKMGCAFCRTGQQGFAANLTAAEMLNQILSLPESEKITNMVLMGMGEPFDNTDEVLRALAALTEPWGLAWSPRRITVSTVGLRAGMNRFLAETQCHLAVSLHNPFPAQRLEMMPAEKAFPIKTIVDELRTAGISGQRRLSFEYIVFAGVNDTPRHAAELVRLLKGLTCRVNLIRFHAHPSAPWHSPSDEQMESFRAYLNGGGIICTVRRSRGEDISAACGLLSTKNP